MGSSGGSTGVLLLVLVSYALAAVTTTPEPDSKDILTTNRTQRALPSPAGHPLLRGMHSLRIYPVLQAIPYFEVCIL